MDADNFLDFGISFLPGQINREARVFRLNTYLESGKIRIMNTCPNLTRQIRELKFKQNGKSTTSPWRNEPEDKDDHAVVCAEWIVMELPKDPNRMLFGVYSKDGNMFKETDPMEDYNERERSYGDYVFDMDYSEPEFYHREN